MILSTRDRVIGIVASAAHLSPEQALGCHTPLVGSGVSLDSVAILELLVELESEFHIELSPEELVQAKALETIATLADFVDSKVMGRGDAS